MMIPIIPTIQEWFRYMVMKQSLQAYTKKNCGWLNIHWIHKRYLAVIITQGTWFLTDRHLETHGIPWHPMACAGVFPHLKTI